MSCVAAARSRSPAARASAGMRGAVTGVVAMTTASTSLKICSNTFIPYART